MFDNDFLYARIRIHPKVMSRIYQQRTGDVNDRRIPSRNPCPRVRFPGQWASDDFL